MANTKLTFFGTGRMYGEKDELYVDHNEFKEIEINVAKETDAHYTTISLDEKTAIRLVRELRRQIGIIKMMDNGKS